MTIQEFHEELKKKYAIRKALIDGGFAVGDDLKNAINIDSLDYIHDYLIPEMERVFNELTEGLDLGLYFKSTYLTFAVEPEDYDESYWDEDEEEKTPEAADAEVVAPLILTPDNADEAAGKNLRITFPDDKLVLFEKKSIQTFIKALCHIGLDRVAAVGIDCAGYNLVDTRERTDGSRKWQELVDGKWVYIYFSNMNKVIYLHKIANYYGLNIIVEGI